MGVVQGDVGFDDAEPPPARRPWWRRWSRRRTAVAVCVVAAVGVTMCLTGIGTGDGPLGPPPGYGAAISRNVGDEVTEGATVLVNHGWFTAHIESIRPLPVDAAASAVHVTAVEMAPTRPTMVGMADGRGYDTVDAASRGPVDGYEIAPQRRHDGPGQAEVLVRLRVDQPGTWRFRGYEVVYRSAGIRHRMVVGVDLQLCAPRTTPCPPV